jgi:hypothetical protein
MRQRVPEAAHVELATLTLDTDTTVHTLFGNQMGGRKSYSPKNKGKKSYQPILSFWRRRGSTLAANCVTAIAPISVSSTNRSKTELLQQPATARHRRSDS